MKALKLLKFLLDAILYILVIVLTVIFVVVLVIYAPLVLLGILLISAIFLAWYFFEEIKKTIEKYDR